VVTRDRETAAFFGNVSGGQCHRHFHIEDQAAGKTVNVIVAIGTAVVPARLIRECQLLDLSVLDEEVQRTIDSAVGDPRVALPDTLEHFARRQMFVRFLDNVEHYCTLRRLPVAAPMLTFTSSGNDFCHEIRHANRLNENESRYRMHSTSSGIESARKRWISAPVICALDFASAPADHAAFRVPSQWP
jgi:hypothetical protein